MMVLSVSDPFFRLFSYFCTSRHTKTKQQGWRQHQPADQTIDCY